MIAFNFNPSCKEAETYYCDFLNEESQNLIPESINEHINNCQICIKKVNQLKGILLKFEDYPNLEQKQTDQPVINWLKLHFEYIGKPVTCETVKPFLPGFFEPAFEVKIPTPITVHIDNCKQCQEDLEIIRKLNLNRKQLHRLCCLFAEKKGDDIDCSRARTAIFAVVSMYFGRTTKEILNHLCTCTDCRKALYQFRETFLNGDLISKTEQKDFPCEKVSESDIFDYTIPYGIDPANDQYAKFRQSLTSHICSCPNCLGKMQQLHKMVFGIIERAESGIATIYHIDESVKTEVTEGGNVYAGFPIRVEMAEQENQTKEEKANSSIKFIPVLKQKILSKNIKPLFKIGAAAAAVILIAAALFLSMPTAKAVTLENIYKAVEKVKNVHISSYIPGKKEPIQQQWISRTLNINIIKNDKEFVLWDITNKIKKIKNPIDNGPVETTMLSTDVISEIQNIINRKSGLLPFSVVSDVPKGIEWTRIGIDNGVEVYDLIWVEKSSEGHLISKKWKFFIERETGLPQKVEFYQKSDMDFEYNLKYTRIVNYLDDDGMYKIIKKLSL